MKLYPSWKSNLALFLILILLVAGYFFLQLQKASQQFQKHSREHSEVVAGVVELNIRNAITSSASLEAIYSGFLKNSTRFLYYLESIEPFSESELSAFAAESGLTGVKILQGEGTPVSGPVGWLPNQQCFPPDALVYREDIQTYLLSYFPDGWKETGVNSKCIIVGIEAEGLDRMRRDLSLEQLLEVLNRLPGIAYVRFEQQEDEYDRQSGQKDVVKNEPDGAAVSKHKIEIGRNKLVVALEAEHFRKRMTQMRKELVLFVLFLCAIGSLSSWWLYRSQRNRLNQARGFERQLARQHEEAALGRAASTITHELRNPLNAIGIGLQRLQYEAEELSDEHRQLLTSMREAVERSNSVISRLRQYIHDFQVEGRQVNLTELIERVLGLYRKDFKDHSISLSLSLDSSVEVKGDRDLLGQLFDNLLRNALEAQPDGGYLNITMGRHGRFQRITVANGNLNIADGESEKLFEPYFTTKTKGTGLGLSISRKIVEAHKGTIDWCGDYRKKEFALVILLPGISVHGE